MSAEEIVSTINGMKEEPQITAGEHGEFPPAPGGYRYGDDYTLLPLQ